MPSPTLAFSPRPRRQGAYRNQGQEFKGVLLDQGKHYMIMRGLGRRRTAPIPGLNQRLLRERLIFTSIVIYFITNLS